MDRGPEWGWGRWERDASSRPQSPDHPAAQAGAHLGVPPFGGARVQDPLAVARPAGLGRCPRGGSKSRAQQTGLGRLHSALRPGGGGAWGGGTPALPAPEHSPLPRASCALVRRSRSAPVPPGPQSRGTWAGPAQRGARQEDWAPPPHIPFRPFSTNKDANQRQAHTLKGTGWTPGPADAPFLHLGHLPVTAPNLPGERKLSDKKSTLLCFIY